MATMSLSAGIAVDPTSRNLGLSSAPCNSLIIPSALSSRRSRIHGAEIVQAATIFRLLGSGRRLATWNRINPKNVKRAHEAATTLTGQRRPHMNRLFPERSDSKCL